MSDTVAVLYVEDESATREMVTNLLQLNGYSCIVAENGREGLELYRSHTPDIVLSDIRMPVMSGLEMARAIRADFPEAQFIFMTALGESKFILDAIDIGVNQYVIKPVAMPKLLAAITHCAAIIRLKAEAQRLKHLEAIGVLAGGLAHDFNNLLQVVLGYVSLAKMSVEPENKAYTHLEMAESMSKDARELSQRLLTFSRGGNCFKQKIPLTSLVISAVKTALGEAAITPAFDLASEIPPIMFDMNQLRQVISNLTINAVEAMPQGGKLEVCARISSLTQESGLPLPAGDYVLITFSDTGKGIPPRNLPKIFDPYFTTKEMCFHRGQGLGLSVCHSIIRKHGGLISADSSPGAGATFSIWLPLANEKI